MKLINMNGKPIAVLGQVGAGKLQELVESLKESGETVAKAVYAEHEYKDLRSARGALHQACKSTRSGYSVHQKGDGLWLVRDF